MVTSKKLFTKTQLEIIRLLLDEEGHSQREMSIVLEKKESNLSRLIKDLESRGIIYVGKPRIPKGARSSHMEFPYYLKRDINLIIRILKYESKHKPYFSRDDAFSSFLYWLAGSEYFESLLQLHRENIIKNLIVDAIGFRMAEVNRFLKEHRNEYDNPEAFPKTNIYRPIPYIDGLFYRKSISAKFNRSPLDFNPLKEE
jgi:DNA-binding Lrp family transcriptional regulator